MASVADVSTVRSLGRKGVALDAQNEPMATAESWRGIQSVVSARRSPSVSRSRSRRRAGGREGRLRPHFHFPALTFDTASKNPLAPMCAVRLV